MEKYQKKLILFMPSMDGGGVEKNIVIIGNYLSKHVDDLVLITFGLYIFAKLYTDRAGPPMFIIPFLSKTLFNIFATSS